MVTGMNSSPADNTIMERPLRVVELVGAAGAGKTSLIQALSRRSRRILIGAPPDVRAVASIPFYVRNILLLMPTLLRVHQHNSRRLTRREIAWMAMLKGWDDVMARGLSSDGTVIVLDQGPVFLLAQLHWFGPESLRSQSAKEWWDRTYKQWADILDVVVWLDASDPILVERIRTRDKWHLVKEQPEPDVIEFLARYRAAYEQVISVLTGNGSGPKVLRLDTAREPLDKTVNRVLVACGLKDSEETA
jgi:shikimate kinase